jgi:hypothetical protein
MLAASPITRQTVGRTFTIALSLLGAVAASQLGVMGWILVTRSHVPPATETGGTRLVENAAGTKTPEGTAAATEAADFGSDPLKAAEKTAENPAAKPAENPVEAEPGTTPTVAALTQPKPTTLPPRAPGLAEPEQSELFKESIRLGKLLRDRQDMSTALIRFREASTMDPKSPEAIYEIAMTFEKMQLPDKAAEQWRRIYDMGEPAGPYYTAAEARLNQSKREAMTALPPQTVEAEAGIEPGKTLGVLEITAEDQDDRSSAKHLTLRIPIKARAREKVEVRDLTIQVLFYDIVDNQNLVQTTANVSSRWTTAPADWLDSSTETLEVDYQLPIPDAKAARRENRKYFGYLVRVYYKNELQASAGHPEKLVQQFPPEPRLPEETNKK